MSYRGVLTPRGLAILFATLMATSLPVSAVIDPGMPLPKLVKIVGYVAVGEVTAKDAATQTLTARFTGSLVNAPPDKVMAVDLSAAPKVFETAKTGGPIVIFGARIRGCSLHVADTLVDCVDAATGTPPTWKVTRANDGWKAFPGTTPQLVAELQQLTAAPTSTATSAPAVAQPPRTTPTDQVALPRNIPKYGSYIHFFFPRYAEVMKLRAKPVFMMCADINADKLPDLLVGYADSVQMFQCTSPGFSKVAFKDITAECGLKAAKGAVACFELYRTDGQPSVMIGRTLYTNAGGKFTASPVTTQCPETADVLACGLAPEPGGKLTVLYVTREGLLYRNNAAPVTLWKEDSANRSVMAFFNRWGAGKETDLMVIRTEGPMRYALDGSAADDLTRMTGESAVAKLPRLSVVSATPISIDGTDLGGAPGNSEGIDLYVVSADTPDLGMYNRTQGFYIPSRKLGMWRNGPGLVTADMIAKAKGGVWSQQALMRGTPKVVPIAMAAGDFNRADKWEELLFVTQDLRLYIADNLRWPWNNAAAELVGP